VAGGKSGSSSYPSSVEIIDSVDNKNTICQNLANLPVLVYGGVGSINNVLNVPLICAGRTSNVKTPNLCQSYKNGVWQNSSYEMNDGRYSSSFVELEDKEKRFLVVGGSDISGVSVISGEVLGSQGWSRVNGPTSGGSNQACMVLLNSSVGLLIGGGGKNFYLIFELLINQS
jgi:hypothetical protein